MCEENFYFHVSQTVVSRKQLLLSYFPNCCVKKTAFTFKCPKLLCQENSFYFHIFHTVVSRKQLLLSCFPNCCVKKTAFTFIFPKLLCQENSFYFHISQTVVSRKQFLLSYFPNCCPEKKITFAFIFPKLLCQETNFYFHISQTVVTINTIAVTKTWYAGPQVIGDYHYAEFESSHPNSRRQSKNNLESGNKENKNITILILMTEVH